MHLPKLGIVCVLALGALAPASMAQVAESKGGRGDGPPVNPCDQSPATRSSCLSCLKQELRSCRDQRDFTPEDVAACREAVKLGYIACLNQIPGAVPTPVQSGAAGTPDADSPPLFRADLDDDLALTGADVFLAIDMVIVGAMDQVQFFGFLNDFFAGV